MNDSDRNIMASMRHEACESHCDECGECIFDADIEGLCEDCESIQMIDPDELDDEDLEREALRDLSENDADLIAREFFFSQDPACT